MDLVELDKALAVKLQTTLALPTLHERETTWQAVPFKQWRALADRVAAYAIDRGLPILGVNGSQGSGKSTLARELVMCLERQGKSAAAVSLDDFYLTRAEREGLAKTVHPLAQTRGVPGTHDTAWMARVFAQVTAANGAPVTLRLPEFSKGLDDRAGEHEVTVEVLVVEGWCLGVREQSETALLEPVNALEADDDSAGEWRGWVNRNIRQHYQPLWSHFAFWLHLRAPDFAEVFAWRQQQEQSLPASQRMSSAALQRFIQHYERLTLWQWEDEPLEPGLTAKLDTGHQIVQIR